MGHEDHDHDHEHPPGPGDDSDREAAPAGSQLAAGSGAGRVLFLDAPRGLAGDMVIAALVDLGVPRAVITDALAALPVTGYHVHFGTRTRSGIVATSFDVHVETK